MRRLFKDFYIVDIIIVHTMLYTHTRTHTVYYKIIAKSLIKVYLKKKCKSIPSVTKAHFGFANNNIIIKYRWIRTFYIACVSKMK